MTTEAERLASLTDADLINEAHAAWLAREQQATAILAGLRERIQADRDACYEHAIDYGELGSDKQEARYYGRVAQCDDLLKAMDAMEAGQ